MNFEPTQHENESVADTIVGHQRWTANRQEKSPILLERSSVGRYELIYRLGSGGMATVYVARLSGLAGFERLVAIKVIHQHLADSKKFVDMFLDEARVAAAIHHPNVAEIYEVGKDRDQFFMVGEYVQGHDLGKLLRRAEERRRPISHGLLSQIGAQICHGLHAAHETRDKDGNLLNLIHRDVSPNNILISFNGFVKIIDFGVAWASNRLAHTESGALKGKIGYVAPEQITGQILDRRSDIFSAGVIQYIMATMTHPFPGNSDAERLHKIVTDDLIPPREVNPDIDSELERIILKAMSSSPDDRYDSAMQMAQDLESYADSTGDVIKAESLSSLMHELFEGELMDHQSSLTLYREARQRERGNQPDYMGDVIESSGHYLPSDTLTDVLAPVTKAVKKATYRSMWISSALTVMVLILAAAVIYLYKEQVENRGEVLDGAARSEKTGARASEQKPEPTPTAPSQELTPALDPEEAFSPSDTNGVSDSVDQSWTSEENSMSRSESRKSENLDSPKKPFPVKRKRLIEKKPSPTLLNSPY